MVLAPATFPRTDLMHDHLPSWYEIELLGLPQLGLKEGHPVKSLTSSQQNTRFTTATQDPGKERDTVISNETKLATSKA